MWLPWKAALALAGALAILPFLVVIGIFARPKHRGARFAMSFARETAVVLGLYALWQYAGTLALLHVDGAVARGRWIADFQDRVHLPSELTVQHIVLHSTLLMKGLNVFYATMHFPGMIAFLIWMFVRHRVHYPQVRNTMVLVTGAALAIQLVPVAPPRLTPGLGFVDTGQLFHLTPYAKVGTPGPDQLSAMPSVHVAWALLVAVGVVVFSTSRWRWLIIAHPFVTILAVVATANHWWLDGIVAAWLIGVAIVVERVMHAGLVKLRGRAYLPHPSGLDPRPVWEPEAAHANGAGEHADVA
jgi:PAP2 superfamily